MSAPPSPSTVLLGPRLAPPRRIRIVQSSIQAPTSSIENPAIPEEWKDIFREEVSETVDLKAQVRLIQALNVSTIRFVEGRRTVYASCGCGSAKQKCGFKLRVSLHRAAA